MRPLLKLSWLAGALVALAAGPAAAQKPAGFDCLIEPSQTLDIRSPVTGLIERVHATRGEAIRRGAPLVTLESTVERAAAELSRYRAGTSGGIQQAEARLQFAEKRLKRRANLAEDQYTSVQERDDAEGERDIARAELQTAREVRRLAELESAYATAQLGQRVLKSPIDGVVVEQNMHAGELADASEAKAAILKIAQTNPLRVRLILPFVHYARVKPGMVAEITPEPPLQGRYQAAVTSIDRVVDAASGTFQVRIDLPNPKGQLPGGTKCRAVLPGL
jgi:RND family efflux transporter MFP subunit